MSQLREAVVLTAPWSLLIRRPHESVVLVKLLFTRRSTYVADEILADLHVTTYSIHFQCRR